MKPTADKLPGLCQCSADEHAKTQCENAASGPDGLCDECRKMAAILAAERARSTPAT